ncbi:MAG: hypothetical protein ACK53X_03905, partial [Holosporales bacterium]
GGGGGGGGGQGGVVQEVRRRQKHTVEIILVNALTQGATLCTQVEHLRMPYTRSSSRAPEESGDPSK